MDTDEICVKISDVQHTVAPSAIIIANRIQQIRSVFVSQADKLNDEQLR